MRKRSFSDRVKSRLYRMAEILKVPFYRHYYDFFLARQIVVTPGILPLGQEVGIYLIYPSTGILASHLAVLEAMRADGISPVVVSNLPLTDPHRASLASASHKVLERPNIGYDFGGYRDAILLLRPALAGLKRLWILNDSAWMINQPQSWFSQARKLDVDFAAASFALTNRRVKVSQAPEFWPPDMRHKRFHYGSFALSMGSNILKDSRFIRYWRKLAITSHKNLTVRRGEIALTQWILHSGFSHAATCDFGTLQADLNALSALELDDAVRDALFLRENDFAPMREQIMATDPQSADGRQARVNYLIYLVLWQGPAYALALFAIRKKGFHFLKKAPARLGQMSRDQMLQFAASLPPPQGEMIADEIRMMPGV